MVAPAPDRRLARRPHRGERHHVDLGAGEFGARDRPFGDAGEDAFEPIVARVVEMIGLGGGEQDAVDARAKDAAEPGAASGAEAIEDRGQRIFQVAQGAAGPAFSAASVSTSTIWRSSRAK